MFGMNGKPNGLPFQRFRGSILFRVVEHIFVINLVYWMLAFDAQTTEKKILENGAEPSGKKGRVGKGLRVLVTLGLLYASLDVVWIPYKLKWSQHIMQIQYLCCPCQSCCWFSSDVEYCWQRQWERNIITTCHLHDCGTPSLLPQVNMWTLNMIEIISNILT